MQLYFIRHGQSENNILYDQTGSYHGRSVDPELTDMGRQQAKLLAQFLSHCEPDFDPNQRDPQNRSGFGIMHLYTSLMVRAIDTAAPVAEALGLPLVAWIDLHERGGIYINDPETGEPIGLPGLNGAELSARCPRLILSDSVDPSGWWNRPFETPEQWPIRARRFLLELIERHGRTTDRVAVISHGGFYNQMLTELLKMPYSDNLWFELNNTAVTRIDFHDEGVDLVYLNHVDHLPKELIT